MISGGAGGGTAAAGDMKGRLCSLDFVVERISKECTTG